MHRSQDSRLGSDYRSILFAHFWNERERIFRVLWLRKSDRGTPLSWMVVVQMQEVQGPRNTLPQASSLGQIFIDRVLGTHVLRVAPARDQEPRVMAVRTTFLALLYYTSLINQ